MRTTALGSACVLLSWVLASATYGGEPSKISDDDKVQVGDTLVDKKLTVRMLDVQSRSWGEREFYNQADLKKTPPLKYRNRVYVRWHPGEGRAVLDLAEADGYFGAHDRFLLPASVVPGEWLGFPKEKELRVEFLPYKPNFEAWQLTDKKVECRWSYFVSQKDLVLSATASSTHRETNTAGTHKR